MRWNQSRRKYSKPCIYLENICLTSHSQFVSSEVLAMTISEDLLCARGLGKTRIKFGCHKWKRSQTIAATPTAS